MRGPRWDDLRAFLEVAELGSLSAAAAAMGLSAATLGRRIDALETVLGFRLMRRGPSGVALTHDGARVLELVRAGADRLGELDRLARHLAQDAIRPPIRISSTEPMVADVLAPELPRLQD
ncbi:MAG: LysR family transcriptional regulator [Pseudomonadota bacterium]